MDTVVIDEVTYTKASILAKKFRYTTDYIGQLCRTEKVTAQLVGRSWYVSEDSLENYSAKRIESIRKDEKILENNTAANSDRPLMQVSAPLSKKTKKMLADNRTYNAVSAAHSTTRYEHDFDDLLPIVTPRTVRPLVSPALPSMTLNNSVSESETTFDSAQATRVAIPIVHQPFPAVSTPQPQTIKINSPKNNFKRVSPVSADHHLKSPAVDRSVRAPLSANQSAATSTKMQKAVVPFTPSSVVASSGTQSRGVHGLLTTTVVLCSLALLLSALMLDVEVYFEGSSSSMSFDINQAFFSSFFE